MTNCSCIGYNIRKDDKARWEKTCNSSSTFVQIKYRSSTDQVQIKYRSSTDQVQIKYRSSTDQVQIKYRSSTDQVQIKMVAVNCVRKVNITIHL